MRHLRLATFFLSMLLLSSSTVAADNAIAMSQLGSGPYLKFSSFLGGSENDQCYDAAIGPDGSIVVVGWASSPNFPVFRALDSTLGGACDAFVAKYSPQGDSIVFCTLIGGSAYEQCRSVAIGPDGGIFITGTTQSSDFPVKNAYDASLGGFNDAFLLKLSSNGDSIVWSTFLGGGHYDEGFDVAVDSLGQVFFAGAGWGGFPVVNGPRSYSGMADIFLAKFAPDGQSLNYSTYLGGSREDEDPSIVVDRLGRIYVTGRTQSPDFPRKNAYQPDLGGWYDAFLSVISTDSSSFLFSSYFGGSGVDWGTDIAVDSANPQNVYVVGSTSGAFPLVAPRDSVLNSDGHTGHSDLFLMKVSTTAYQISFSTLIGGNADDRTPSIAIGRDSALHGAAYTWSTDIETTAMPLGPAQPEDAYLFRVDSEDGSLDYAVRLGGSGSEGSDYLGLALGSDGTLVVAGAAETVDFPLLHPIDSTVGYRAGFITSFSVSPSLISLTLGEEDQWNLVNHTPVFNWSCIYPLGETHSHFQIEVGDDSDWTSAELWSSGIVTSADSTTMYSGTTLSDGILYWVRLKVESKGYWSSWYETSFRMNSVPSAPTLRTPVNLAVTGSTPTLWITNGTDAQNDPLIYEFAGFHDTDCVAGPAINLIGVASGVDSTGGQIVDPLAENCRYWWMARAYDGFEYSPWTPYAQFMVNGVPEAPSVPMLDSPPLPDGKPIFTMLPTLTWQPSFDPDPGDTVRYKLELSDRANFSFGLVRDSLLNTSLTLTDSLEFGRHYYWRVTGRDKTGLSALSSVKEFWTWKLGDVNHSHGVDLSDLSLLIGYLTQTPRPSISPKLVGDVSGDCRIDLSDLSSMIGYLTTGGMQFRVGCE